MRPNTGRQNLVRAQASFVALLYVFLCTFGTLTHTHVRSEATHSDGENATLSASSHRPHPKSRHVCDATVTPAPICAFCDWQANSVSPALAPLQLLPPQRLALMPVVARVLTEVPHTARGMSRAPPLA